MKPAGVAPPIINGHYYSFASIELRANGRLYYGIVRVNYRSRLAPGVILDNDGRKAGRTPGDVEHTCEIEMLQHEYQLLIEDLGPAFGLARFDIQVTYAEEIKHSENEGDALGVTTHTIVACRIVEPDLDAVLGTQPNTVRIALDPWTILYGSDNLSIEDLDAALLTAIAEQEAA